MHDFTLYIREWDTLDLLGEIPQYEGLTFTTNAYEPGSFRLDLNGRTVDPSLIQLNRILEVRRNGVAEFTGILRSREIGNPDFQRNGDLWTLLGPDLLWFTSRRTVVPPAGQEFDAVTGVVAETALIGYVQRHLTNPTSVPRNINQQLTGITFDTQTSGGAGDTVDIAEAYVNLQSQVLTPTAEAAELRQWVEIRSDYSGYRYRVSAGTDRTEGTANAIIFSAEMDNLAELSLREHREDYANTTYVLGEGDWSTRTVTTRSRADGDIRSEDSISDPNAATLAALQQAGDHHLAAIDLAAVEIAIQPIPVGHFEHYHDAWSVGDMVTVSMPSLETTVDKRIVQQSVSLSRAQGEQVTVQLGSPPKTIGRVVKEHVKQVERTTWRWGMKTT